MYVERIDEYRMTRRVLMPEVSGLRERGRPRSRWMDGEKVALGQRNDGGGCASMRERSEEWRALVHMQLNEFHAAIFCFAMCSFGPPSHALVVITWRGVGCRYMMRLR